MGFKYDFQHPPSMIQGFPVSELVPVTLAVNGPPRRIIGAVTKRHWYDAEFGDKFFIHPEDLKRTPKKYVRVTAAQPVVAAPEPEPVNEMSLAGAATLPGRMIQEADAPAVSDAAFGVLEDIPGIGAVVAQNLEDNGFPTPESLASLSVDELREAGINAANAGKVYAALHPDGEGDA